MSPTIGLDLSCTSTGVCDAFGRCHTIAPSAGATDPARRLHQIVDALEHYLIVGGPKVAVVEAPVLRFPRSVLPTIEVHGAVKLRLFEAGLAFVEVSPAELKKFATGTGRAGKDAMVAEARAQGAEVANDDEADAWWLRQWGLEHVTLPEEGRSQ